MEAGLLKEFLDFHENLKKFPLESTNAEGPLQSIGYKEFIPFLDSIYNNPNTTDSENFEKEKQKIIESCGQRLGLVTRRYAKKQLAWFFNKWRSQKSLLFFTNENGSILFNLDTTDKPKFLKEYVLVGVSIAQKFLISDSNSENKHWTSQLSETEKNFQVKEPSEFSKKVGSLEWKK